MVTVERIPSSRARRTPRIVDSSDSSTVAPELRWLNVGLAAKAKWTSSRPVSRRRS